MNRSIKFSLIALAAVMILWACGGAPSAAEVGEKFLNAMAKGDIEGAKKFATKDAQTSLDLMQGNADAKKEKPDVIVIGDVKEEGEKATLNYTENGAAKTLKLVKEEGEWKAAWEKGAGNVGNSLDGLGEDLGNAMEGALNELGEKVEEVGEALQDAGEAHTDHEGHDHE